MLRVVSYRQMELKSCLPLSVTTVQVTLICSPAVHEVIQLAHTLLLTAFLNLPLSQAAHTISLVRLHGTLCCIPTGQVLLQGKQLDTVAFLNVPALQAGQVGLVVAVQDPVSSWPGGHVVWHVMQAVASVVVLYLPLAQGRQTANK